MPFSPVKITPFVFGAHGHVGFLPFPKTQRVVERCDLDDLTLSLSHKAKTCSFDNRSLFRLSQGKSRRVLPRVTARAAECGAGGVKDAGELARALR
jgi:hypothetical protein